MSIIQKLKFFGFLACTLFIIYLLYNNPGISLKEINKHFSSKYFGRIINKGTHKGGMTFTIENNAINYTKSVSNSEVFNIVRIGDSIFKEENSFKTIVTRKKDTLCYNVLSFRDINLKAGISSNEYWDSITVNTSIIKFKARMYGLDVK
jgi:hypothetical protein